MEGLKIPIGAPLQQLDKDLTGAKSKITDFAISTEKSANKAGTSFYIAGQKITTASKSITDQIAKARSSFESTSVSAIKFGHSVETAKSSSEVFGKSLTKGLSALRTLAYILPGIGIAGIFNLAFEALGPLLSGLAIFNRELSTAAKESNILGQTFSGSDYSTAIKTINELSINIDLAKQGFLNKNEVLKQYNETIGQTTGQVTSLDEAELALIKNGDAYIKMSLYKAAAQIALGEAAKKAVEAEQARLDQEKKLSNIRFNKPVGLGQTLSDAFSLAGLKETFAAAGTKLGGETQYGVFLNETIKKTDLGIKKITTQEDEFNKIAENYQKKAADIAKSSAFNFDPITPKAKKDVKTIKDIYAELALDLEKAKADLNVNSIWELGQKQVEAYNSAIKKLIELGIKPASKEIEDLTKKGSVFLNAVESLNFVDKIDSNLFFKQKKQLPSGEAIVKPVEVPVKATIDQGALYTSGDILKEYYQFDLLPQIGTSFTTFFDDILTKGEISFKALGQSITRTFASVLANEATTGVLALLGAKGSEAEKKDGGLFKTLLGLGKGVGGAAKTGGAAATGGLLLPVLAAVGSIAALSFLFKKKKVPTPAPSSSVSTSAINTGAVDISGGRVVFEISGVNLVGVLNRAGAKLARYGTI